LASLKQLESFGAAPAGKGLRRAFEFFGKALDVVPLKTLILENCEFDPTPLFASGRCSELQELALSECDFTVEHIAILGFAVSETLEAVECCGLSDMLAGTLLGMCPKVERLILYADSDSALESVGKNSTASLRIVKIGESPGHWISDDGVEDLLPALQQTTDLSLHGQSVSVDAIKAVVERLPQLRRLWINRGVKSWLRVEGLEYYES
jgi:hypothetical protein